MTREEAIEVYHGLINTKIKEAFEFFAPELRESEGEKIREALIWHLKAGEDFVSNGVTKEECIAYLEKQKDTFENGRQLGIMQEQARQELEWPDEKQKEQKQEWSEEHEKLLDYIIKYLTNYDFNSDECYRDMSYSTFCKLRVNAINFLKSLRPSWKPSELEKGALRTAIHILTDERSFPKAAAQLQNILNAFE